MSATRLRYINEVSHGWQRRNALRRWKAGELSLDEVTDADPRLRSAAKYHGWSIPDPCPVCGKAELQQVRWVYGDNLGWRSGSARSEEEIERMVAENGPVTVHVVEVCQRCGWNHIVSTFTAVMA